MPKMPDVNVELSRTQFQLLMIADLVEKGLLEVEWAGEHGIAMRLTEEGRTLLPLLDPPIGELVGEAC